MMGLAEKKTKEYLDKINKVNKEFNIFLHINENALSEAKKIDEKVAKSGKKGRLYGKVIAVKSAINVKGLIANCASHVLENYISTFDATAVEKIKKEDGIIIGMTNCDEFCAGGSGENSAFGCCVNPSCPGRVPGGSSSGSAAAVAAGLCDMALGSDTGGSIRNPSSNCGVVGIKPSYGFVSRYGLIDLSMSLDQIGPIAKNVEDATLLLDVIRGKDEKDTKTFESKQIRLENLKNKKIKIGILKIKGVDKRIEDLIDAKIAQAVKKYNWQTKNLNINHIDLAVETYYPLVYVEFFSATRRFDGRRYGYKIEDKAGKEVLRRIEGGKEITKAEFKGRYYNKSLEVKEIIKEEFEKSLKEFDIIISPVVPSIPWKVGEGNKMSTEKIYAFDALTIPANLAEICAMSIPCGYVKDGNEKIPIGLQIMAGKNEESKMVSIASEIEKV